MATGPSSESLDGLPPLGEVIRSHGLTARKSLGQHFLLDLNLTGRIARAAGNIGEGTVIEIGPGPGGLTRALLAEGAGRIIAIERDARCLAALDEIRAATGDRLHIIEDDAREVDIAALGDPPRRIVANLPYNVATHLLIDWLGSAEAFERMVLMFQKEVADRITASPGGKIYGRLSVAANWRCRTERLFNVPARAFTPSPKVASAVVSLTPFDRPPFPADPGDLETVTAAAFGQRRKMLRGALKSLDVDTADLLDQAGVAPDARAEDLSVEQFAALARAFTALRASP